MITDRDFESFVTLFIIGCLIINIIFTTISIRNFYCNGSISSRRLINDPDPSPFSGGLTPRQFRRHKDQQQGIDPDKIRPFFRRITTLASLSFLLDSVCLTGTAVASYTGYSTIGVWIDPGNTLFWFIGKILINCMYIGRLKFSFQGSVYRYSNKLYIVIIAILCGEMFLWLFYFLSLMINVIPTKAVFFICLSGIVADIICEVIILILFVTPLLKLTRQIKSERYDETVAARTKLLLQVTTRYTVLTAIVLMSFIFLGIGYGIMYRIWWIDGQTPFTIWLLHLWGSIDPVINIICLTLYYNFPISTKLYGMCCCLCHKSCTICCKVP